jgi:hypothetical protein
MAALAITAARKTATRMREPIIPFFFKQSPPCAPGVTIRGRTGFRRLFGRAKKFCLKPVSDNIIGRIAGYVNSQSSEK